MSAIILSGASRAFVSKVEGAFDNRLNGDLKIETLGHEDPSEVVSRLAEDAPSVVALGPKVSVDSALRVAEAFDRERPDISVLLVAEPTPALWERALRAGARDIIDPELDDSELKATFERARESSERRRARLSGVPSALSGPTSHTVVVLSPKGGSGKTTVASNLAVSLSAQHPGDVVLLDLDLQFGDISTSLRLEPDYSIADTVGTETDATSLKAYLTLHASSQTAVLCAPEKPEEAEDLPIEHVRQVISTLQSQFAWVIVDTGAGLDDVTLAAAELASDMVFVAPTDVASVRSLRKELEIFDRIGLDTGRRHFVLNRSDARVGLDPTDIAESIGIEHPVSIPSSQTVPLSMNQGTPFVEMDARSRPSQALFELTARIDDTSPQQTQRTRRFAWGGRS